MHALRVKLLALVLMAGMLIPASALARVITVCRMAQKSTHCCCKHESPEVDCERPTVDRGDCCRSLASQAEKASSVQAAVSLDVPPAALLARLDIDQLSWALHAEDVAALRRSRAPPAVGPPLIQRTSRLLS